MVSKNEIETFYKKWFASVCLVIHFKKYIIQFWVAGYAFG